MPTSRRALRHIERRFLELEVAWSAGGLVDALTVIGLAEGLRERTADRG